MGIYIGISNLVGNAKLNKNILEYENFLVKTLGSTNYEEFIENDNNLFKVKKVR